MLQKKRFVAANGIYTSKNSEWGWERWSGYVVSLRCAHAHLKEFQCMYQFFEPS